MKGATTDASAREQLLEWWYRAGEMKLAIKARHTGVGRYKKHDTARLLYLDRILIPELGLGKAPNTYDVRMCFGRSAMSSAEINEWSLALGERLESAEFGDLAEASARATASLAADRDALAGLEEVN